MKLAPYKPYMSKPTAESRQALARQMMNGSDEMNDMIVDGLVEIIGVEGPILSSRAFTLYARKGGLTKVTPMATRRFTTALQKAITARKILFEGDSDVKGAQALLWLPKTERVVVREYGDRGFEDIPASELGEVMFEIATEVEGDEVTIFQEMAQVYGLKQVPKSAVARLEYVYKKYVS